MHTIHMLMQHAGCNCTAASLQWSVEQNLGWTVLMCSPCDLGAPAGRTSMCTVTTVSGLGSPIAGRRSEHHEQLSGAKHRQAIMPRDVPGMHGFHSIRGSNLVMLAE